MSTIFAISFFLSPNILANRDSGWGKEIENVVAFTLHDRFTPYLYSPTCYICMDEKNSMLSVLPFAKLSPPCSQPAPAPAADIPLHHMTIRMIRISRIWGLECLHKVHRTMFLGQIWHVQEKCAEGMAVAVVLLIRALKSDTNTGQCLAGHYEFFTMS